jgi:putative toxin-antitoxin system antitoxin component (TIGR02293 family)
MSVTSGHNDMTMAVRKKVKTLVEVNSSGAEAATMKRLSQMLAIRQKAASQSSNTEQMLIDVVRAGVPKAAYDRALLTTGISPDELAGFLHISPRTLRRYVSNQILPPEQSERMVALARLYTRGEEVFGSLERFKDWMSRPQLVSGEKSPTSLLDTSIGIGMITDELGRIEHGVFA